MGMLNKLGRRYDKYWMEETNKMLRKHRLEENVKEVEMGKREIMCLFG